MIRLQKYLADAGLASRRRAEKLISQARVKVNDILVTELGTKVDPEKDRVYLDNKLVKYIQKYEYYMLNKPLGVVSTARDDRGRKTVVDILEKESRIYPVGRLDINTKGLIFLTNDGALTYRLTHPKHEIIKTYIVVADKKMDANYKKNLEGGCDIGPYKIAPCQIKVVAEKGSTYTYEVKIHEGKNRQVRNMFAYAKLNIKSLMRVGVGDIELGNLRSGEYRRLTKKEINYLKSC